MKHFRIQIFGGASPQLARQHVEKPYCNLQGFEVTAYFHLRRSDYQESECSKQITSNFS